MHWLTLALLIVIYSLVELKGVFPKGSNARNAMQAWHELFGISVIVVVLLRMGLRRLYGQEPGITPIPPVWQTKLAHTMHWVLYIFLLAMPVLGWFILSAKNHLELPLGIHLLPLVAPNKSLAGILQDIHETLGNIGYYLIGLHAIAALYHHYWRCDNTLRRMLW